MTQDKHPTGDPKHKDKGSHATGAQKKREQELSDKEDKENEVKAYIQGDPEIPPTNESPMVMGDPEIPPSGGENGPGIS